VPGAGRGSSGAAIAILVVGAVHLQQYLSGYITTAN
jgi:hypothetical protein